MNPLELESEALTGAASPEQARAALDGVLHQGVHIDGQHRRLYGWRLGNRYSLSLGVPVLGGHEPVIRGNVEPSGSGVEAAVRVGARVEAMVGFWAASLLFVGGCSYQLVRQAFHPDPQAGGRPAAMLGVIPGAALVLGLLGLPLWFWRRRAARSAEELVDVLRSCLEPDADVGEGSAR